MRKIFRKELFTKHMMDIHMDKHIVDNALSTWVELCDGMEVIDDKIIYRGGNKPHAYTVHEAWCETVSEKRTKLVFSKDKYIEDVKREGLDDTIGFMQSMVTWVPKCEGKEVVDGRIDGFIIYDEWCEEVEV